MSRYYDKTTYLGVGVHNLDLSHYTRLAHLLREESNSMTLDRWDSQLNDFVDWGFCRLALRHPEETEHGKGEWQYTLTERGMQWMFFMADKEVWDDPLVGGFPDV